MLTTIAALYVLIPALLALAACALASLAPVDLNSEERDLVTSETTIATRTARSLWARAAWEGRYGSAVRSDAFRRVAIAGLALALVRTGQSAEYADVIATILTGGQS